MEPFFAVFSPEKKGIVENAAIHANNTVNLCMDDGRSTDYHAVSRQISVLADFGYLCRVF